MANLPNVPAQPGWMLRQARAAFDRLARLHTTWRGSLTPGDQLNGARRTLTALDETLVELQACRAALAHWIEEHDRP